MHHALRVDPDSPVDAGIAQIQAGLSVQLAALELRMTKWMFICLIITFALVTLLALPTLGGPALGLFVAGSATQAYAVWRM